MSKKTIYAVIIALSLAMTLSALLMPGEAAAQTKIRLATIAPSGTSIHHSLQAMGDAWKRDSAGSVLLTIHPDGVMGGDPDMVRRMRIDEIQASLLTVTGLSEIDPSLSCLQKMPLIFRSLDELDYVRAKLQPELEQRLAEKGFVVLFWADAGWVHFFTRNPALRPDDFKKMKMLVGTGDMDQIDIMKKIGFMPVPLLYTESLQQLQSGMIDAVAMPPFYALAGQLDTVAKHMLELNWVPLVGAAIINKKSWDALPPSTRDVMLKTAQQAGRVIQAANRKESIEAVEAMKKRGLTVHEVPPQDVAEWQSLGEKLPPLIVGPIVPPAMFDRVQQLLKGYRESQGKGKG